MDPDLEHYLKELEEFSELFSSSVRSFGEVGLYDKKLLSHLVYELQKRAANCSAKLEQMVK